MSKRWTSTGGPAAPAPEGALVFDVECRTHPSRRGVRHRVRLTSDWSLETPHDLEAERIATAMGGYLSCVELADVAVPVVREVVQLMTRSRLPRVGRTSTGRWRLRDRVPGCRCQQPFDRLVDAVHHERELFHWEGELHRRGRPASWLLDAVYLAYQGFISERGEHGVSPQEVRRRVREPGGAQQLWYVGVPMAFVRKVHGLVGADEALPVRLYEAAAFLRTPYPWLRVVWEACGDPDVLAWAAWTRSPLDDRDPTARIQWLGHGLARADIEVLTVGGYGLDQATTLSEVTGHSVPRAGHLLAEWHRVGCSPGPGDLLALARVAGAELPPRAAALDHLGWLCRGTRPQPTRTQAALVLAVVGDVGTAHTLLAQGVRSPALAASFRDADTAARLRFLKGIL